MRRLRVYGRGWFAIGVGVVVVGPLELGEMRGRIGVVGKPRRERAPTDSSRGGSYGAGSWIYRVDCRANTPRLYAGHDGYPNVGLRGQDPGDKFVAAG